MNRGQLIARSFKPKEFTYEYDAVLDCVVRRYEDLVAVCSSRVSEELEVLFLVLSDLTPLPEKRCKHYAAR